MKQRLTRRLFTAAVGSAALVGNVVDALPADADDAVNWPTHPLKLIVPTGPGGGNDIVSRLLADALGKSLGQAVIVQNIAGGGNVIGVADAAKAAPDGYTMVMAPNGVVVFAPFLRNLPFNPVKDLAPVSRVNITNGLMVISPEFPGRTYQDMVKLVGENPGKYNYGSDGIGSLWHMQMEMFLAKTGLKMTHVPFNSGNENLLALMGNQVDVSFMAASTSLQPVLAGTLQAVAVMADKRLTELPNVPAFGELIPDLVPLFIWLGVFVPARTPKPIVDKLAKATTDWLNSPAAIETMKKFGAESSPNTPEEFAQEIAKESALAPGIVKIANIKME